MNNDQEWRALFLAELKEIKQDVKDVKEEMSSLKLKVAGFASFIGAIISALVNTFK